MSENVSGTEARVCADIARRQQLGIRKYGTTVEGNPLPLKQWLIHSYEETLDQAIYLKRAAEEIEKEEADMQSTIEALRKLDPNGRREPRRWEYFRDPGYYDMYAVRPVGEKRWGHCFHLVNHDEAKGLAELLTELSLPGRSGTHDVQQETGSVGTGGDSISPNNGKP